MAATETGFDRWSTEELLGKLREAEAKGDEEQAEAIREELVRRHTGLVRAIAAEFSFTGEPFDDLVQAGYLGLLGAVANFDLARGTKFSTYATHLIKGEIRHYIRDKHGSVHVPLWIRSLASKVTEAQDHLYQTLGRPPTLEEIAHHLGVKPGAVREALKARDAMTYVSLDAERRVYDPRPRFDLEEVHRSQARSVRRGQTWPTGEGGEGRLGPHLRWVRSLDHSLNARRRAQPPSHRKRR